MSSHKPVQIQISRGGRGGRGGRAGGPAVWLTIPHDWQGWVLGSEGEDWFFDHAEGAVLAEWSGLELRVRFALQSDADLFAAALWPEGRTPKLVTPTGIEPVFQP